VVGPVQDSGGQIEMTRPANRAIFPPRSFRLVSRIGRLWVVRAKR
jgi:hypothetical protein